MGFHQIAKYYYSGWQEPGAEVQFLVNQKTWNKLPEDLQEILRVAMRTAAYDMYAKSTNDSADAWNRMQEDYPEVTHKVFPPEVIEALREDRKSTRLNSSHVRISYAVFCLKK